MVRLREAHLKGDLRDYATCRTCQASRPSTPAFYGSLVLDSLTVRKAVPALEKLARFYNCGVFENEKEATDYADLRGLHGWNPRNPR
jgi:hypothetical protein